MRRSSVVAYSVLASFLMGCAAERDFSGDVAFLKAHGVDVVVLGASPDGPRVAIVPAWQGRVMTSSAKGDLGTSFGWLHDATIKKGGFDPQITVFGGEERFWVGPEGGQFAFYFDPGKSFDFPNWRVPAFIDRDPWQIVGQSETSVKFRAEATLTNWSGNSFSMRVDRDIELLGASAIRDAIGLVPGTVSAVGFETKSTLTNTGAAAWTEQTGMPSIWILGMLKHGPKTTVVIPFQKGRQAERGEIVNDAYFGKVPSDRLVVKDSVLFFCADGELRSKIGIPPQRAKGLAGSYDGERGVLTIVQANSKPGELRYVNSLWKQQDHPFAGDAINSYNDGKNESGGQLGPFYELETSSPALDLAPGASYTHVHRTIHIEGEKLALDAISKRVLGVGIDEIEGAFERP